MTPSFRRLGVDGRDWTRSCLGVERLRGELGLVLGVELGFENDAIGGAEVIMGLTWKGETRLDSFV